LGLSEYITVYGASFIVIPLPGVRKIASQYKAIEKRVLIVLAGGQLGFDFEEATG